MKIKIHRGTSQIGGSIHEVATAATRIINTSVTTFFIVAAITHILYCIKLAEPGY